MHSRKQLASVINHILTDEQKQLESVENSTVDDYKVLNNKCDIVIGKIKKRKNKKTIQFSEE